MKTGLQPFTAVYLRTMDGKANTVKKQSRPSIIQKLRAILPQVREQAKEKKKELER